MHPLKSPSLLPPFRPLSFAACYFLSFYFNTFHSHSFFNHFYCFSIKIVTVIMRFASSISVIVVLATYTLAAPLPFVSSDAVSFVSKSVYPLVI